MNIKHAIFGLILLAATPAFAGGATKVNDAIWNDGHLYGTVVTPTSFVAPPEHSTDMIYSFAMSGLAGQHSIAEAAPGDTDFNGGRWSVVMAVFTADGIAALGDGEGNVAQEITNDQDMLSYVDLGYIELFPTGFYFECPMLP